MSETAQVRQAVERAIPDTVAWLQELVRVPSLLGHEEPAQRLIEERLVDLGFKVASVQPDAAALAEHPESGIPLLPNDGRRTLVGTRRGAVGTSL